MAYDVKVKIDLAKPVGQLGFGTPLILLENADKEVPYTVVHGIVELAAAGIDKESVAYKAATLLFAQNHAPDSIAVCAVTTPATDALADGALVNKGWRQLIVVTDGETASTVQAISALVETMEHKMYYATMDDSNITTSGLRRTVLFAYDASDDVPCPVAALVGATAGHEAGSITYKNIILKGITPMAIDDVTLEGLHDNGCLTVVSKAGDIVTSEGKAAGGEYIDVVDSEDYIIQQLAYETQRVLNHAGKVPYDNNGIGLLESVAKNVLHRAYTKGMIATNDDGTPAYWVDYALRENTSEADRATRKYLGGKFGFSLAGAIHEVEVTGTISV